MFFFNMSFYISLQLKNSAENIHKNKYRDCKTDTNFNNLFT